MEAFIKNLIDKFWPKPKSILFIIILEAIISLSFLPDNNTQSNTKLWVFLSICFLLNLFVIIMLCKANSLPKAQKKSLAILFIVNTENERQFEDIKRKLIEEFEQLMSKHSSNFFKAIYVPYHRISSVDLSSKRKIKELLEKTRSVFLISIKLLSNDQDNSEYYEMSTHFGVLHITYKDKITQLFQKEFDSITSSSRTYNYCRKDTISVIKSASKDFYFICKYFFGLSFFLNGEVSVALTICEELYAEIFHQNGPNSILKYLKVNLPERCYEIYMSQAIQSIRKYYTNYTDNELDVFFRYLVKANQFKNNEYLYYLLMAIYNFSKNRNIQEAKKNIRECSKIDKNSNWRYSDAFLCAYEGRSLEIIYRKYKIAFRVSDNLIDIASFIEHILEFEPDKVNLHFALGLIYNELGDNQLTTEHFNSFSIRINESDEHDFFNKIANKSINAYNIYPSRLEPHQDNIPSL